LRARLRERGLASFYEDIEALSSADEAQRTATLQSWDSDARAALSELRSY
jgi:hypothetical protein